jgi:hypothetical protein
MSTNDDGHRAAAIEAIAARQYHTAGDEYSRAGWHVLADPREGVDPFDPGEKGWIGAGLQYLVLGGICYRVAGAADRATRRGVEGVALARDLAGRFDHPVQRACLQAVVADFRVVGALEGADEAYSDAAAAYEDAGESTDDPQYWGTTPLFQAAVAPIKQLARGPANGEIAVDWGDLHGSDPSRPGPFLAARARYRRRRFPTLLETALDAGRLAAPRGTTEYDTDHHRCPHCGATSVNWVAESTLCLRCSRPAEPQ